MIYARTIHELMSYYLHQDKDNKEKYTLEPGNDYVKYDVVRKELSIGKKRIIDKLLNQTDFLNSEKISDLCGIDLGDVSQRCMELGNDKVKILEVIKGRSEGKTGPGIREVFQYRIPRKIRHFIALADVYINENTEPVQFMKSKYFSEMLNETLVITSIAQLLRREADTAMMAIFKETPKYICPNCEKSPASALELISYKDNGICPNCKTLIGDLYMEWFAELYELFDKIDEKDRRHILWSSFSVTPIKDWVRFIKSAMLASPTSFKLGLFAPKDGKELRLIEVSKYLFTSVEPSKKIVREELRHPKTGDDFAIEIAFPMACATVLDSIDYPKLFETDVLFSLDADYYKYLESPEKIKKELWEKFNEHKLPLKETAEVNFFYQDCFRIFDWTEEYRVRIIRSSDKERKVTMLDVHGFPDKESAFDEAMHIFRNLRTKAATPSPTTSPPITSEASSSLPPAATQSQDEKS
jgi:hypothetical protein